MTSDQPETTQLLLDWAQGDQAALEALAPRIYKELHHMAAGFLRRERQGHTLQPTALVHELYLKLIDIRKVGWNGRAHFFVACAQIMRRILVDAARKRAALRRSGEMARLPLGEIEFRAQSRDDRLLALDDALTQLERVNPRGSRIVEYRYFGGLTIEETARTLGVSAETVMRDWRLVRGWLLTQIT